MRIARGISVTNTSKPISTAPAYDADATAFFTAASITDTTQKSAVNTLVLSLKSANIWTKMKALYPVVGGISSSHAVNLKQPGTFNLSFATGWTHSSTGMQPLNAYADTFLIPRNILSDINLHISYYSRTQSSINGADMGSAQSNNTNELSMYGYYASVSLKGGTCYTYPSEAVTNSTTNTKGLQIITRTANNVLALHWNGSKLATNTATKIQTTPNVSTLIGSNRNGATPIGYTNRQCAFASIGDGLTDAEALAFYNAVQAYQTTLQANS